MRGFISLPDLNTKYSRWTDKRQMQRYVERQKEQQQGLALAEMHTKVGDRRCLGQIGAWHKVGDKIVKHGCVI